MKAGRKFYQKQLIPHSFRFPDNFYFFSINILKAERKIKYLKFKKEMI